MSWRELLQKPDDRLVMPWLGGRRVFHRNRAWKVTGDLPGEFGWYEFAVAGRRAVCAEPAEPCDHCWGGWKYKYGYLIGDRFIHMGLSSHLELDEVVDLSYPTFLVDPGLDRFAHVSAVMDPDGRHIYGIELFPTGPEDEVQRAFVDREESVDHIKGVIPALDLAFRFAVKQRQVVEERRAEMERRRQEEERLEQARQNMGTGLGRRTLAATDFEEAAKAALRVGGAELLDARPGGRNEMVVQYRLENQRLECTADRDTLRIIDSGICLTDHHTEECGDTYFTLESLPAVVSQAIRQGELVVYRRA